jgi:hypothetical protein
VWCDEGLDVGIRGGDLECLVFWRKLWELSWGLSKFGGETVTRW